MMLKDGLATSHAAACARIGANALATFNAEYSQGIALGEWRAVLREVREK